MILHQAPKTGSEAKFRHAQSGLSRILRRVEITDDKAKRPTMGGSNEPPILLPKRIEQQAKQLCTPKAQSTKEPL